MSETTPENDAQEIKKAIDGQGEGEKTIINILANRTALHRQNIRKSYKSQYGTDIIEDLKSFLSGDFEDAIVALMYDPIEYDCVSLMKAMKGLGTDEETLIEIIATRPAWMVKAIKARYKKLYDKDLEEEIKDETSGDFRNLLVSLLQGGRSQNKNPDPEKCKKLAQELYDAGEGKWGTDESVFNRIFATASPMEFGMIARSYHNIAKTTVLDAIKGEFGGDMKDLLEAIIYAAISPSEYFARKVKKSIKGAGTDEKLLIRVLVSRDEIDMPQIKQYYKQLYGKDMIEDIKDDTSGNFKNLLVELAGH